jgi:ATP-dependent Clp protease adaptor protein ClpS
MSSEKTRNVEEHHTEDAVLKDLVLFNDEFNTFEFVIKGLIDICGHEAVQAEQCALIAHYKGKCTVNSGSWHELKPQHDQLSMLGLTVSIT